MFRSCASTPAPSTDLPVATFVKSAFSLIKQEEGVLVGVLVRVSVGVFVGMLVAVAVGVAEAVGVWVGPHPEWWVTPWPGKLLDEHLGVAVGVFGWSSSWFAWGLDTRGTNGANTVNRSTGNRIQEIRFIDSAPVVGWLHYKLTLERA
jgi:hypothetical protein